MSVHIDISEEMSCRKFYEILGDFESFIKLIKFGGYIICSVFNMEIEEKICMCGNRRTLSIDGDYPNKYFITFCRSCSNILNLCLDNLPIFESARFVEDLKKYMEFFFLMMNMAGFSFIQKQLNWPIKTIMENGDRVRVLMLNHLISQKICHTRCRRIHIDEMLLSEFDIKDDGFVTVGDTICARRKKYKDRVEGPWVVAMVCQECYSDDDFMSRLFIVENRNEATILPLIKSTIDTKIKIWTDNLPAYKNLCRHGYDQNIVNLKQNAKNPFQRATASVMDKFWNDLKVFLFYYREELKLSPSLQPYFDEFCFRKLYSNYDMFLVTLNVFKRSYF